VVVVVVAVVVVVVAVEVVVVAAVVEVTTIPVEESWKTLPCLAALQQNLARAGLRAFSCSAVSLLTAATL
jgi:hypothetical protein